MTKQAIPPSPLTLAIPKETAPLETRVAATPGIVQKWVGQGFKVQIQEGAGIASGFLDSAYIKAGAQVVKTSKAVYTGADVVLKVHPPQGKGEANSESALIPKGATLVGLFGGLLAKDAVPFYDKQKWRVFSLELVPRISRAQAMDVLSSQMNLAGYRAVVEAAKLTNRVFPMMMTAAGTVPPVQVLVLGAGVAGLQAIATAKRLGARVMAFDIRAAAKEQVESLGAQFVEVEAATSGEDAGGYAKEMDADYRKRQQEKLAQVMARVEVVICSALVPGKAPPVLITEDLLGKLKPGAVVIDLAAGPLGGNCAGSVPDQLITTKGGVQILGARSLETRLGADASNLYAKNVYHFLELLQDKDTNHLKKTVDDPILIATHLNKVFGQEDTPGG